MSNLNEQQFAQYSSRRLPGPPGREWQETTEHLPASMERHAPGEYQPTLPGMEKMLKGEQTHVGVLFKHEPHTNRWTDNTGEEHISDVPGSRWSTLVSNYSPDELRVRASSLRPTQDWLDDNYLHSPIHPNTMWNQGARPKVEKIQGKNVIQDGHHRAAREILGGAKSVEIERWG